jgi:cytochrome c oxidase subunit 2
VHGSLLLEITWMVIPLFLALGTFVWGAEVYFRLSRPPDDALQVNVVGKRWMWKIQHPTGRREINELHVPLGTAIRLNLTSEDVIHSFYIPAYRTKSDALPGRYTTAWFRPERTGRYHLFCAEYCGTLHSGMIGWVEVMEPEAFQRWLAGETSELPMAAKGERLFGDLGCATCHQPQATGRGPSLEQVYNRPVKLATGETITANEEYLRESILNPTAKVAAGYTPVMPTFRGLINEEGILQLIEYIKSRGGPPAEAAPAVPAAAPAPAGKHGKRAP